MYTVVVVVDATFSRCQWLWLWRQEAGRVVVLVVV